MKVCDFGLARDVMNDSNYIAKGNVSSFVSFFLSLCICLHAIGRCAVSKGREEPTKQSFCSEMKVIETERQFFDKELPEMWVNMTYLCKISDRQHYNV